MNKYWSAYLLTAIVSLIYINPILAKVNSFPELRTEDYTYYPTIKSVNLFQVSSPPDVKILDMNKPAISDINQEFPFLLEFDELGSNTQNYYLKIINCNADWSVSQLNDIQYLEKFNEYPILDRQLSYNTRVGYCHYKIFLPKVMVSGNFLAVVYKNGDTKDIILSKRYIVYEPLIDIKWDIKFPVNVTDRNSGQQIDFLMNYTRYNIINPLANVKVVIRQNFRWDNAITNLKPSFLDENSKVLQYWFFNRENVFDGLNEFRYFDIRSNRFGGQNVAKVSFDANKTEVYLAEDLNRNSQPYSFYADFMDGRYVIYNYESGDREIQPDYVNTTFVLNSPKLTQDIYVMGSFNNWKCDNTTKMTYETGINRYLCKVLLKQGQYNYGYAAVNPNNGKKNEAELEGSFSVTQNWYDILVYVRPFGAISDHLVGYSKVNYNGR